MKIVKTVNGGQHLINGGVSALGFLGSNRGECRGWTTQPTNEAGQPSDIYLCPIGLLSAKKFPEQLEMMGDGATSMRRSPQSFQKCQVRRDWHFWKAWGDLRKLVAPSPIISSCSGNFFALSRPIGQR